MNTSEKKPPLEIKEINSERIVFRTSCEWAICLNASSTHKINHYFLINDEVNRQKIKKIIPFIIFSSFKEKSNDKMDLPVVNVNWRLREYQKEDINFLSRLKSGAIFSEMRTGKTPVALFTWQKWGKKNLIIIVPNILQYHWQKSLVDWLSLPAYIITSLNKISRYHFYHQLFHKPQQEWIVIISKDTFKIDSIYIEKLIKKKKLDLCVIIDEAHFLRNYQSQQSQSIYVLKNASHKLVLTGTPVVNHYTDIYGIFKFLQPEKFFSYWKFVKEYFRIHCFKLQKSCERCNKLTSKKEKCKHRSVLLKQVGGFKNLKLQQELKQLINKISVNRRQKEVMAWLPKIIYHQEYLSMEESQNELYLEWSRKWIQYQPLEVLAKLKTITLNPRFFGLDCYGSKMIFLLSYLKEKIQQKIIIFSTRSETFLIPLSKLLEEHKLELKLVTGRTNHKERQESVEKFQKSTLNILLCNIQIASLGLNLSEADTIIFADRSYSPADNEQAEARFIPTSDQENKKTRLIIDLICRDTIDEKINNLLKRKEDVIKVLNNQPNYFFDD